MFWCMMVIMSQWTNIMHVDTLWSSKRGCVLLPLELLWWIIVKKCHFCSSHYIIIQFPYCAGYCVNTWYTVMIHVARPLMPHFFGMTETFYSFILFYFILFYFTLFYSILFYFILFYSILFKTVSVIYFLFFFLWGGRGKSVSYQKKDGCGIR